MAMTVLDRFKGWGPRTGKPRAELARILGISQPYAMEIARGAPIGSTERLAQVAATFDLSGDDVLESLREWYPHHFAPGVDSLQCHEGAQSTQDPDADLESSDEEGPDEAMRGAA